MTELCVGTLGGRLRINPFAPLAYSLILYVEGVRSFFIIAAAALLHEAGHIICIYASGSSVSGVTLLPSGAVISYRGGSLPYAADELIALSGPLANLAAAAAAGALLSAFRCTDLLLFVFANLFFALLNLLPLRGNDGWHAVNARLLRSLSQEQAARRMKAVRAIAAAVAVAAAAALLMHTGMNPAVVSVLLFTAVPV